MNERVTYLPVERFQRAQALMTLRRRWRRARRALTEGVVGVDVLLVAHAALLRRLLLLQLGEPRHQLHPQQHRRHGRVGDELEVGGQGKGPALADGFALVGHGHEVDDRHVESLLQL